MDMRSGSAVERATQVASRYINRKVSLISSSDVRYSGELYTVDPNETSIALKNVDCLGTENRRQGSEAISASECTYEFIIFRANNIKSLTLEEGQRHDLTNEILEPLKMAKYEIRNEQAQQKQAQQNRRVGYPTLPQGYDQRNYPQYGQHYQPYPSARGQSGGGAQYQSQAAQHYYGGNYDPRGQSGGGGGAGAGGGGGGQHQAPNDYYGSSRASRNYQSSSTQYNQYQAAPPRGSGSGGYNQYRQAPGPAPGPQGQGRVSRGYYNDAPRPAGPGPTGRGVQGYSRNNGGYGGSGGGAGFRRNVGGDVRRGYNISPGYLPHDRRNDRGYDRRGGQGGPAGGYYDDRRRYYRNNQNFRYQQNKRRYYQTGGNRGYYNDNQRSNYNNYNNNYSRQERSGVTPGTGAFLESKTQQAEVDGVDTSKLQDDFDFGDSTTLFKKEEEIANSNDNINGNANINGNVNNVETVVTEDKKTDENKDSTVIANENDNSTERETDNDNVNAQSTDTSKEEAHDSEDKKDIDATIEYLANLSLDIEPKYDKTKSFFDNLPQETRKDKKQQYYSRDQEAANRVEDTKTFGSIAANYSAKSNVQSRQRYDRRRNFRSNNMRNGGQRQAQYNYNYNNYNNYNQNQNQQRWRVA